MLNMLNLGSTWVGICMFIDKYQGFPLWGGAPPHEAEFWLPPAPHERPCTPLPIRAPPTKKAPPLAHSPCPPRPMDPWKMLVAGEKG